MTCIYYIGKQSSEAKKYDIIKICHLSTIVINVCDCTTIDAMPTTVRGSSGVLDDDFRPKKGKLIFGGKRLV